MSLGVEAASTWPYCIVTLRRFPNLFRFNPPPRRTLARQVSLEDR